MHQAPSTFQRKRERLRYLYRHGGVSGVLFYLVYKLVNCFTRLRIYRMAILESSASVGPQLGHLGGYRNGLFSPAELKPFVDDPENDLTQEFLDDAAAHGHTCNATFEGNTLLSYCWNSEKPTHIEHDLQMEFAPGYLYRYKEFTRNSHRGQRLSTYARAEALCSFAAAGVKGFAGYVEADNFSCQRALAVGHHVFPGFVVVLGTGPDPWIWHSPQAKDRGFRVVSTAPVSASVIPKPVKPTL